MWGFWSGLCRQVIFILRLPLFSVNLDSISWWEDSEVVFVDRCLYSQVVFNTGKIVFVLALAALFVLDPWI